VLKLDTETIGVCIADVCGKGMPAAITMANLQAAVRTCATSGMRPRDLCERVNQVMAGNMRDGKFITFFYGVLTAGPAERRQLTYCNAGHNPPLLAGRDASQVDEPRAPNGAVRRLTCGGGVLGVFPHWRYEEEQISLGDGDRLLMFTDGVTESRSDAGEEFGERRLMDLLSSSRTDNAAAMMERVVAEVTCFANGTFDDDLTVLAVVVGQAGPENRG
jgi:sigma-B regulation protein RsbU (phosphoserine phosphatase)